MSSCGEGRSAPPTGQRRVFVPFSDDFEKLSDGSILRARPYELTKRVNVKERWRDRPLGEVFTENFQLAPEYLAQAAEQKKLLINGLPCTPQDILRNGDVVSHTYSMQEPPLRHECVEVLAESEALLVVDKVEGLPCHPQGSYQKTSLTEVVRRGHLGEAWEYVHPINRLDRQTSGIVLLAKSRKGYMLLSKGLHDESMSKLYLARVAGSLEGTTPVLTNTDTRIEDLDLLALSRRPWQVTCNLPLHVEKHKAGQPLTTVVDHTLGKESTTHFMALQTYPDGTSLILCRPITGRTHQIRVHLASSGCPILGDRLYGSRHHVPTEPGTVPGEVEEDRLCLHAAAYTLTLPEGSEGAEELMETMPRQVGRFEQQEEGPPSLAYKCLRLPSWVGPQLVSRLRVDGAG